MPHTAPVVVWTHRAERRLHFALSRSENAVAVRPQRMADIDARLAAAFPQADHLIVLDLYLGFRPRPGEHVLLLDVRDQQRPDTFIVKLADEDRLRRECDAWRACRPPAFSGDRVFMTQEVRSRPDAPERFVALVYQDAQSHIGTDRQTSLEEAFLSAVRFGAVAPASLAAVLDDLFNRLGDVLYHGAKAAAPAGAGVDLNWDNEKNCRRSLADSFDRWGASRPADELRRHVNAAFPLTFADFLDPVDFYRFLADELRAGVPAERWTPRMLRGPSHGDLHGRNVLVGVREGDDGVVWPALFDYEHMAADNLIGWDFVKLETELKVRAYPHVFGDQGPLRRYVVAVQAFEQELAERTELHRPNADWPAAGGATPRERLLTLLLTLRRLAGHHLGKAAGRPEEWLEEYYFLLGCYGVYSVRFENQSVQERAGAFVSGGVAAARFAWQRREKQTFTSDEVEAVLARRYPGYREPLQIAWGWNRSGDPVKLAQAHTLLTALAEHYAHVLHVWYELAFNLVKQKKRDDALALLAQIGERFRGMLDEDVLSLWGRCCKNRGDDYLNAGLKLPAERRAERVADFTEADGAYQEACTRYEQAYLLNSNWFPGINLATLRLLRAALAADLDRKAERDDYLTALRRPGRGVAASGARLDEAFGGRQHLDSRHPRRSATTARPLGRRRRPVPNRPGSA